MDCMPSWNINIIVDASKHAEEVLTISQGERFEGLDNPSRQGPLEAFQNLLFQQNAYIQEVPCGGECLLTSVVQV